MSSDNAAPQWRPTASDLIAVGALIAAAIMWLNEPSWIFALPITLIVMVLVIFTAARHQSHPIRRVIIGACAIGILIWSAWSPIWNSFHADYPNIAFQWPVISGNSDYESPDKSIVAIESKLCSGVLHRVGGDLRFGGDVGEGESICIIDKAERNKVLAVCPVGTSCRVKGIVLPCRDSGECSEITRITSVEILDILQ